jgi:predicted phage tail protein
MKRLVLHGFLAKEFGPEFRIMVPSVADAIRLMEANFPGRFKKALERGWFVISTTIRPTGMSEVELHMNTSAQEIHIRPVAAGSFKGFLGLLGGAGGAGFLGGIFSPLGLGAAATGGGGGLLGIGAGGGFGSIALGLGLLGILMLISSAFATDEDERETEERASFLFDGAVNTSEQGVPVPIVYGRIRTGSVVIAGGLSTERILRTGGNSTDADRLKFTPVTKPALKTTFGAVIG